jgi:L-arabinose isomerase
MWIAGLQALQKPLLHLHTQFNRDLPWSEIDMDFMNLNQSAHGDREFGFLETRMGLRRKTVVGHWRDPQVASRIGTWARAAAGWREAQELRVARFGDNMRDVAVTEGDKVDLQIRLGVSVNGYGVDELADVVAGVAEAEVDDVVTAYEEAYDLAPGLRGGGDRRDSLREAARIEAGLRSFLDEGGFRAFTDTFENLDGLAQLPGIAVQRLMADGYGFGAEGDWKTAALVRIAKVMSSGLEGGTSFMEDYTYDLSPGGAAILGAHMLEVCPSIAADRPSCEIHPLSIGGKADPVRLVFTAAAGPAVVAALLDLGDRFRLVLNEIEIVRPPEELPRLPVARALWRPQPDFATAAEAWLRAGGPHHSVLCRAIGTEAFADLAEIAGIELVVIDERTRIRDVANELRWNQAYYRLAGGL